MLRLGLLIVGLLCAGLAAYAMRPQPPRDVPVYHALPAFGLVDEQNARFDLDRMKGSIWIADFIFLGCPDVCPRLTERMAVLQGAVAQHGGKVRLVSFSVDPANDTPDRMREYAQTWDARPGLWHFVTGEAPEIERTVVDGFKIAMGEEKTVAADGRTEIMRIFHGEKFVLIDAEGRIRGYYDSDEAGRAAILRDVDALLGLDRD